MTRNDEGASSLVRPFPIPGPSVRIAYRELGFARAGSENQQDGVGDPRDLPRPWEPATCTEPTLRRQLWGWLDEVVLWLNHEYAWDAGTGVVACWPAHPGLVHEVALLADRRFRAGWALTSDPLNEWHHISLPGFRLRTGVGSATSCDTNHGPWPARAEFVDYTEPLRDSFREGWLSRDLDSVDRQEDLYPGRTKRIRAVDLNTGEIY